MLAHTCLAFLVCIVLIWEISGDMIDTGNGVVATPLIDATNAKIRNPAFPCAQLRDPRWALADQSYRYAPAEPATADWSNYRGPSATGGSANDFNGAGAGASIPAPGAAAASYYGTPSNAVYRPPAAYGAPAVGIGGGGPADGRGGGCPSGHTGYVPVAGCTSYVNCLGGRTVGVAQPCSPGTLFSMDVGGCTWAANVQCDIP